MTNKCSTCGSTATIDAGSACAQCGHDRAANAGWLARLVRLHAGRSWTRLTLYTMALLILAPISITLELLRDLFDSAAEWVNDLGRPLQKWAYFRKPNAKVEGPAGSATSNTNQPI